MLKTKRKIIEGPIFIQLLLFSLPIMLTGLLQVAYNMADNIIVGQFSGDPNALAAITSTSSLTTLAVNFLMGLATGSGVVVAQAFGADEKQKVSRTVHTAITFAIIIGAAFGALAFGLARVALEAMGTKRVLIDGAVLYFRIIAIGIPATTIYNFGAAILRSIGNSKLPLYILGGSGLLNVALNLFFVIVCGMSVDGVAIATVISQYASAVTVILILVKNKNNAWGLDIKRLGINKALLLRIVRYGAPAGLQSSLFSITNVIITSAANQLPKVALDAKAIAFNIDGMVYTAMDSYLHSSMTFVGQNYGAKKYDRIIKSTIYSVIQVAFIGFLLGQILIFFSEPIIGLYLGAATEQRELVVSLAQGLMRFILSIYFLCGIMHTISGALRGLGNSIAPMLISIIGTVVVRVVWVVFFYPMEQFHTITGLYYCYPITWISSIIALVITFVISARRAKKRINEAVEEQRVAAALAAQ
ncbi:MAG: MATE family efflux transporter [Clostridia bacterium]|nr:MATE family efflux transporter [Clostridia bacterium]